MSAVAAAEQRSRFFDQFRLLTRYPNFGLLWSGQVVSHIGDAFNGIALIWLVQELTGSRSMMGAISAVISATALFGLVAGALVDRWDRRRVMIFSDVTRALIVLAIPLLWLAGRMAVWHLFVVGAGMGLVAQLFYPAKQAIIPKLVGADDLTGANALSQMAQMLLMALGYGLGGALLGVLLPQELFALDSATFAVSALMIWLIRASRPGSPPVETVAEGEQQPSGSGLSPLRDDVLAGLRYMRGDALIATTIPVALIANFVFAPLMVLLAAWAKDVIQAGAQGYGLLEASFLLGSLLGALAISSLTQRFRRGRLVVWGVILMGLPLILFALIPNLWVNSLMLAIMGFMNGIVNISIITAFQQRVPDSMMGRVFGALTGLSMLATPLGVALGGVIADYVSLVTIFAVIGAAMALLGVSLFWQPVVAEFD